MYPTYQKIDDILQIKGTITLPEKSYFVRNEQAIRICYIVAGRYCYINLPSRLHAACFLKANGIIDAYAATDENNVELFTKGFYYTADHKGRPVMCERLIKLEWDKITLTKSDVQLLAAREVWERVSKGEPSWGSPTNTQPPFFTKYSA